MKKEKIGPSPMISLEIDPNDTGRQAERAQLDLFRSISIGKMIAVIGSGVTTTYGYDTWGEMLKKLLACLRRLHQINPEKFFDSFGFKYANEFFGQELQDDDDDYNLTVYGSLYPHLTKEGKEEIHDEYERLFGPRRLAHRKSAEKTFPGLNLPECNGDYLPQDYSHLLFKLAWLVDSFYEQTLDFTNYSESIKVDSIKNESGPTRIKSDRNLLDPLDKIRSQLRIRRFATFNYDMEIESLLEDYDYPYGTLTKSHGQDTAQSQSRLGSIARSISLSKQNASELISLAAVPADDDEAVVHLHGAVTHPEDMVVSQKDYDATYIENHPQRNAFEDARKLMFGGNSVLYIGVGMREEDVLRPLRYLATVVTDRPIYALIPSLKSRESDLALAKKIKSAYRINAIPYGPGSGKMPALAIRFKIKHPLGDEFIPLHEEVDNIEDFISNAFLEKGNIDIDTALSEEKSPRLRNEAHHFEIIRWFTNHLKEKNFALEAKTKEELKKSFPHTEAFISAVKSAVTSIALNHAIGIMAQTAHAWRQEWKIGSVDAPGEGFIINKMESLHNIDLKEPIETDKEEAKKFIARITNDVKSISVARFPGGRGLSSLSSISKMIPETEFVDGIKVFCHVINLNHVVAANSILPAVHRAISEKQNQNKIDGKVDVFLINGAERLMDRSGTEVQNLAALVFLHHLAHKTPQENSGLKVVFLSRRKRTARKLCDLFGIVTQRDEDYRKVNVDLMIDKERFRAISELCSDYRWPYFVTRTLCEHTGADPDDKESILNHLEDFLQSRIHSVDAKNKQSVFCGAVLDAFHAHAQRRYSDVERVGLVVQHVVLKWMFAVRIPINCRSILLLPEIDEIQKLYGEFIGLTPDSFEEFVLKQIRSLHRLNFLLELEKIHSPIEIRKTAEMDIRYVLHINVTMFLAHKRGLSLGWMDHREWNSATLCYAMMDGGPMLNNDDYKKSCDVYEAFLKSDDLRALHCAFAIVRGHLYAPNAMRAGLMYFDENEKRSVIDLHVGRLSKLRSAALDFNRRNGTRAQNFELFEIWITNEIGIMKFVQGDFHDSVMLFREALDFIKRQREKSHMIKRNSGKDPDSSENPDSLDVGIDADPAIILRIRINLSMALIERAHFEQARKLIDSVLADLGHQEHISYYRDDRRRPEKLDLRKIHKIEAEFYLQPEYMLLRALSFGCKAQIELLTADLDKARSSIDEAVKEHMADLDLVGVRGWLYGLSAQIASASGDEKIAAEHWMKALAAARGSLRPDLILSMEIAEIEFQIKRCKGNRAVIVSALSALSQLEKTARALGSHKSRAGILLIRARALLFLEQTESAREAIIDSICLSLLNGMRLKRVSGLVLMVGLMALRGERKAAKELLHSIRLIAIRFRYIRAALDIDRLEREIEMEGSVSSWAGYLSEVASE
jgi:hypothetical protein